MVFARGASDGGSIKAEVARSVEIEPDEQDEPLGSAVVARLASPGDERIALPRGAGIRGPGRVAGVFA